MAEASAQPVTSGDHLVGLSRLSRNLLLAGLAASSLLTLRLGAFTLGDYLLFAGFVALALGFAQPAAPAPNHRGLLLLALITLGTAFSTVNAVDPIESLAVGARIIVLAVLLTWQMRHVLRTPDDLRQAVQWWLGGAALCASGTIAQYVLGPNAIPGGEISNAGRYTGFTGHVSDMGGIAGVGAAAAVIGAARADNGKTRLFSIGAAVLCGVGLILSGSVSGMLAVLVALIHAAATRNLRLKHLAAAAVVAVAAIYLATDIQAETGRALTPSERVMQVFVGDGQGSGRQDLRTSRSRLETLEAAWGQISNPLVGAGLDPESGTVFQDLAPHNIVVAALYQGGLLLALAILIPLSAGLWWSVRRGQTTVDAQINAAVIATATFAMTAPSMFARYFWIPLGLAYASRYCKQTGTYRDA